MDQLDKEYTYRGWFRFQAGESWMGDKDGKAVGYAWKSTRSEDYERTTAIEIPDHVFPHLVAFAMKAGYLSMEDLVDAIREVPENLDPPTRP